MKRTGGTCRRGLAAALSLVAGLTLGAARAAAGTCAAPAGPAGNVWGQHVPRPPETGEAAPRCSEPEPPGEAPMAGIPGAARAISTLLRASLARLRELHWPGPPAGAAPDPGAVGLPALAPPAPAGPPRDAAPAAASATAAALQVSPLPAPAAAETPGAVAPVPAAPAPSLPAFLDAMSSVVGEVEIGPGVTLAAFSSVRNEGGVPIHLSAGVSLHAGAQVAAPALERGAEGAYLIDGQSYSVYLGENVLLAGQARVHGPCWIEEDVYLGRQAVVSRAHVGRGVVVEERAEVDGVTVPAGRYVPAGTRVATQAEADRLPDVTFSYPRPPLREGAAR